MKSIVLFFSVLIYIGLVDSIINVPIFHLEGNVKLRHHHHVHHIRKLQVTTGSAAESYDLVPYINITLGSNSQQVNNILLDTGSAPLWVTASDCKIGCWSCIFNTTAYPTAMCLDAHNKITNHTCDALTQVNLYPAEYSNQCGEGTGFNPSSSSSFQLEVSLGPFVIQYGDGSTYLGDYVKDILTFNQGGVQISNFIFSVIHKGSTNGATINGILGFSPPEPGNSNTLITSLLNDNNFPIKQFSLYYPTTIPGTGELTIGGTNTKYYQGGITWINVHFYYWWVVTGGVNAVLSKKHTSGTQVIGILDTGTSWLVGPTSHTDAIASWLGLSFDKKNGLYYGLCSHVQKLPTFNMQLGTTQLLFDTNNNFNGGAYQTDSQGRDLCYVNMQGGNDNPPMWIVGSVFIRQYYAVFDFTNLQPTTDYNVAMGTGKVGFAKRSSHVKSRILNEEIITSSGGTGITLSIALLAILISLTYTVIIRQG